MNSMQGFIEEQMQLEDGDPSLPNFLENIALSADTQDKELKMIWFH
jgi:DNA helicase-2/ATP-dependent DNA helicase PcrA